MEHIDIIDFKKTIFLNETLNNIYFYWIDKKDLHKITLFNNDLKYLPCNPYNDEFDLNEIQTIIIFLKNPKIIYGIIKINKIIIKDIKNNNIDLEYLVNNNENKNKINRNIEKNNDKFDELIKKLSLIKIPQLFFLEFDKIYIFEYEINLKNFNYFLKTIKNSFIEFKYPKKIRDKNIIKNYFDNFFDYLIEYLEHLKNNYKSIDDSIILENNSKQYNFKQNTEIIFQIPILWRACDEIIKKIKNSTISQKIINFHLNNNCELCEINNNNIKSLNLEKKKITIIDLNNNEEEKIYDEIIQKYHNVDNFILYNNEINLDENMINIIRCMKSKNIYNECFFILENKEIS